MRLFLNIRSIILDAIAFARNLQAAPTDTGAYHYRKGMELWRAGDPAAGLQHLMSASLDPEFSFYAKRQASLMGEPYPASLSEGRQNH